MSKERRRFFRIDDQVALSLRAIDINSTELETDLNTPVDLAQERHVDLEIQIRQAIISVREKHPIVANVLDMLNQKINLLRNDDELEDLEVSLKSVNLSACGIAFSWPRTLPLGQQLLMTLFLQPKHEMVKAQGYVTSIETLPLECTQEAEPYLIRVDFDNMHESYQELLIQHIVQRQGFQLRNRANNQEI